MKEYIEQFLENIENAIIQFEKAEIDGNLEGDSESLMEILSELVEELENHRIDES